MWRRIYLLLILVRLYFAFSPSYIHPDENFQGPEVIAGEIFGFPHHRTWEFDSSQPVRSVFPLWPVYGLPMVILRWVWTGTEQGEVAPKIIYYVLRGMMFIFSFVLEDWAIHELVHSPRQRRVAMILVASSYVTWTYQTHTFSNSIETLVVLWSLVLIQRILENKHNSSFFTSALLGFLVVFGIFNRITFPAFITAPGLYLIPHFLRKPLTLITLLVSAIFTTLLAIFIDTTFYNSPVYLANLLHRLTFTPLSSLLYNASPDNLVHHGLHPPYTHLLANIPLLLGPVVLLLLTHPIPSLSLTSALTATAILSLFPHQEPRFLLPAVPLFLSSLRLPNTISARRAFVAAWLLFNALLAVLMGAYHQGGVVPMQLWLGQNAAELGSTTVMWWKTYSPPIWLLDGTGSEGGLQTRDLMGVPVGTLLENIESSVAGCGVWGLGWAKEVIVVAPRARQDLDGWREGREGNWSWEEVWTEWRHLNLDDLDVGEEGVVGTWRRVVGRRGLTAWRVRRTC